MGGLKASPWAIRAAVLAAALAVALLPSRSPASGMTDGSQPASIPTEVAGYSYLTGDVSSAPAGRAIALYQHGFDVEFMDYPQAVMLGADGDVYRRVGVAEDRSVTDDQGDPAPMLLSPDGTRVAVGSHDASEPDLIVLDLRTGEVKIYPVPGGPSLVPHAWSPDSEWVAYLSTAEATSPYVVTDSPPGHSLGLLEVETGRARILPGRADVRAAAFSPDGTELAIARLPSDPPSGAQTRGGDTVEVTGLDHAVHRTLNLPPGHRLDGPNAWSPDGRFLATVSPEAACMQGVEWHSPEWIRCAEQTDGIVFLDASGGGRQVPAPLKVTQVGSSGIMGWTRADEVLVLNDVVPRDASGADSTPYWLTAVPLDGQEPRRLTAVQGNDEDYAIGRFHLATGLLADLQVRIAGEADRGRWPTGMRVVGALVCGGGALIAFERVLRRTRRDSPPR